MRLRSHPGDTATGAEFGIYPPLLPEQRRVGTGALALMADELADIEADTAGADHRHLLPHWLALNNGIQIADHPGVIHAGDLRHPRHNTGCQIGRASCRERE